jgi:hypothetical protein
MTIQKLGIETDQASIYNSAIGFTDLYLQSARIIIVGLNPSDESPDNSAFHTSTKSGKAVRMWLKDTACVVSFLNLSEKRNKDGFTKSGLSIPSALLLYVAAGYKIVSCGAIVDEILTKYNLRHFAMPHPSGLNRFWNDKKAGEAKIQEMLEWINKT